MHSLNISDLILYKMAIKILTCVLRTDVIHRLTDRQLKVIRIGKTNKCTHFSLSGTYNYIQFLTSEFRTTCNLEEHLRQME